MRNESDHKLQHTSLLTNHKKFVGIVNVDSAKYKEEIPCNNLTKNYFQLYATAQRSHTKKSFSKIVIEEMKGLWCVIIEKKGQKLHERFISSASAFHVPISIFIKRTDLVLLVWQSWKYRIDFKLNRLHNKQKCFYILKVSYFWEITNSKRVFVWSFKRNLLVKWIKS